MSSPRGYYERCPRCQGDIYYNRLSVHHEKCQKTPKPATLRRMLALGITYKRISAKYDVSKAFVADHAKRDMAERPPTTAQRPRRNKCQRCHCVISFGTALCSECEAGDNPNVFDAELAAEGIYLLLRDIIVTAYEDATGTFANPRKENTPSCRHVRSAREYLASPLFAHHADCIGYDANVARV